jgi:hypothetical protein
VRKGSIALLVAVAALAAPARADDAAKPEGVDGATGFAACRDFDARNASELLAWTGAQPPQPWRYRARETILDAPWWPILEGFAKSAEPLLASVVPHLGAGYRSSPEFVLAWPLSVSLGPALSCTRKRGSFDVDRSRPVRILLEPQIRAGKLGIPPAQPREAVTFALRPGVRVLHQPHDWWVGLGVGVGIPVDLVSPLGYPRAGISPEAVLRLGSCCGAGYVTIALRVDVMFAGPDAASTSLTAGYTYF